MKWLQIIFVIFSIIAFLELASGEEIPIYGCQSLNVSGTNYVLQNDVSAEEDCFIIVEQNITLDLNGHSLEGLSIGEGIVSYDLDNVIVKNGRISNFYEGIRIIGDNNQILNMVIDSPEENGIILNGDYNAVRNTFISNEGNYQSGIRLSDSSHTKLTNITINGGGQGVHFFEGKNNIIENSLIVNTSLRAAVMFQDSTKNKIIDTILDNNAINLYIAASDTSECDYVVKNVKDLKGRPTLFYNKRVSLRDVEASEIFLCDADGSSLTNIKVISRNQHQNGLFLFLTDNASLSNILVKNTQEGISLKESKGNSLVGVQSLSNHLQGILISGGSNNLIMNSTLLWNEGYGLRLKDTTNNVIRNSFISQQDYVGISIRDSNSNLIYNNFINNSLNLDLDRSPSFNLWSIALVYGTNIVGGPFIGGNYWANPERTGFSQTCADEDDNDICDASYTIRDNNVDFFALTI